MFVRNWAAGIAALALVTAACSSPAPGAATPASGGGATTPAPASGAAAGASASPAPGGGAAAGASASPAPGGGAAAGTSASGAAGASGSPAAVGGAAAGASASPVPASGAAASGAAASGATPSGAAASGAAASGTPASGAGGAAAAGAAAGAAGTSGGAAGFTLPPVSCASPVHFTVRLNFVLDDEQIPYYTALDKGWYQSQCLQPEFQPGTGSTSTVQLVGNGSADMGVADTVAILAGQAQDIPLQAFGVVYQHNPTALLIRQSALSADQIQAPKPSADIIYGKTYGAVLAGSPYIFYKAFLAEQKLDASKVTQVNISPPGFTEMTTGRVDFLATFFTTAPVLGGIGTPVKVVKLEDYGQVGYGLSYFSTPDWINGHADVVTRFLQVTQQAIVYTNQNLEESVQILCKTNQSLCTDDKALQTNVEEARLQIPLYDNLTPGKPMFCADPTVWKATAQLLLDAGSVQSLPDLSNSFTNKFITGC